VFTNDDQLHNAITDAGVAAGESFWRLPLYAPLKELLKSPLADMKNTGERYGGAITAALFLQEFVEPDIKWAHLDIAGPALNSKPHPYLNNGGVGFGVRTLTSLIMGLN
jgi:leucyl aminopeptidase